MLIVVVIGAFAASVYLRAHHEAHSAMRDRLRLRAETLAGILEVSPDGVEFDIPPDIFRDYMRPEDGAYYTVYDRRGEGMVKGPSLTGAELPRPGPWDDRGIVFTEIEDGPGGRACAAAIISFVGHAEIDPDEPEHEAWAPPPEELRRFRIQVALDATERDAQLRGLAVFLSVTAGAALVVTILGGLLLARRVLRPVRRMTKEASELSPEDTSRRLETDTVVAELHSLAETLNSALDRLGDAIHRQRQFTADASHELRTPVSVLLGNAELLLRKERDPADYRKGLERQCRAARRLKGITEQLLLLARAEDANGDVPRVRVDLAETLTLLCDEYRPAARAAGLTLECRIADGLAVIGDQAYLSQMVSNLLSNAIRHSPAGGIVSLELAEEDGTAILNVSDQGPGVPREHREKIFNRFYRIGEGGDEKEGAGLGLAIAKWVARYHRGSISVDGEPGEGAEFRVVLPLASTLA